MVPVSLARRLVSAITATALTIGGPLLLVGATGTANAACYNPNSDWPGWTDGPPAGIPPCPMEKVLVTCEWGQAYGPICPGDCRHDLQGGIIDPPDPACRTEKRWIYASPEGTYMGLVPGQSNLPQGRLPASTSSPPQASGTTSLTPKQRQFVDDMESIGLRWGTDQQLINAGESTCAEMRAGQSRARSVQIVYQALKRATLDQATAAVDFAAKDLCPDAPAS